MKKVEIRQDSRGQMVPKPSKAFSAVSQRRVWIQMGLGNGTQVVEFILLGFSYPAHIKILLFALLLIVYLVTLIANGLFILATLGESGLHSPMYFFLCNLSVLDLCYSSVSGPTVLGGLLIRSSTITFYGCVTQMYIALSLGQTECFLLAVMAWDRYVAVCNPLRYQQILSGSVCIRVATTTWAAGFLISVTALSIVPVLRFCGHNIVDHLVCELQALSRLPCMSSHFSNSSTPFFALLTLVVPLCLIFFTYVCIIAAILRIPTAESRHRTFATCGSHLLVVVLFYGTAMGIYLRPTLTAPSDKDKLTSLFYGLVVPALNPLIYTLRNKDVTVALKKLYRSST
ncbi:olfactory receptor 2K2-like [Ambystoma mexicanum]|uniref:olfactory receptor 2K2-like n=1 Tax=Ambystoma mexicanum TaxID=8296 RepID=UPI0037E81990